MPLFGGSVAENPTFTIVPIEGEEFTKRLLTPFHQNKFTLLLRQHFDVDLLLRMMAQEVRLQPGRPQDLDMYKALNDQDHYFYFKRGRKHGNSRSIHLTEAQEHRLRLRQQRHRKQAVYINSPSDPAAYEMFRRVVLHLSAIQDQKQLYAEPLTFERSWTIPADSVSAEGLVQLR